MATDAEIQVLVDDAGTGTRGLVTLRGEGPWHIGRSPDGQVMFDDPYASEFHSVLVRRTAGLAIVDLESMNGTFVNGRRVSSAQLSDGDVIRCGRSTLQLCSSASSGQRDLSAGTDRLANGQGRPTAVEPRPDTTAVMRAPVSSAVDRVRAALVSLGAAGRLDDLSGQAIADRVAAIADVSERTVRRHLGELQAAHGLAGARAPRAYVQLYLRLIGRPECS